MENKINRITDILRRDDGISGAMMYTEQISWILFLKYLNDYEEAKHDEALLDGKEYTYILDEKYRWSNWACPQKDGKLDKINAKSGDDLLLFVNGIRHSDEVGLFDYLRGFKSINEDFKSVRYKIGAIFEFLDNRIANGHTLREVLDLIDEMSFHSQADLFQLSLIYEKLLKDMGSDGGNSGEFYTPRPLIKMITAVVNPQIGETIYDPAAGSCGFLIEAYNHIRYLNDDLSKPRALSTDQLKFLREDTFFGNEKTPLSYVMGVMNMILHGIEAPNIAKTNTLTRDIRSFEEKDRYNCILANPPFGGKEKEQIQQNFPIQANATELLFLQHMMKSLKVNGRCGVVIPEGVLFQTNNSFQAVKKDLLERFNVHTIVSLPSGVFLPYSGVKTNVIFFDRNGSTSEIYYYEVNPPYKLTKNKPIQNEHFEEFLACWQERKLTENSWIVNVNDIKDFDISAKNPNKAEAVAHISPLELVATIKQNNAQIDELMTEIEAILQGTAINEIFSNLELNYGLIKIDDIVVKTKNKNPMDGDNKIFTYIDISSIDNNSFEIVEPKILQINEAPSRARKEVLLGDIVYSTTRPNLKNIAMVNKVYNNPIASTGFCVLRVNQKVNNQYLFYYLITNNLFTQIEPKIRGAQYPAISDSDLKNCYIPNAPLSVQQKVVAYLDNVLVKIEQVKSAQQQKMQRLLDLKSSILDHTFHGKL